MASAAASATGSRLVFVSSDAVIASSIAYPKTANPDPITPYGAAKAAAETAVKAIIPSEVIARASLIIGSNGES